MEVGGGPQACADHLRRRRDTSHAKTTTKDTSWSAAPTLEVDRDEVDRSPGLEDGRFSKDPPLFDDDR